MLVPVALALAGLITTSNAETTLGVTVYTRNGDRTSKHYPDYTLTNLGYAQNHQLGSDYRSIYIATNALKQILGISEDELPALMKTADAFLQGLYPPLDSSETETLNNGSTYDAPLGGAQFANVGSAEENTPDAVWLNGDNGCPATADISDSFRMSGAYEATLQDTGDFYYQSFSSVLKILTDYNGNNSALSYDKAYDVFDLINVGRIQQHRTLADRQQFGMSFDESRPSDAIGARTLSAKIVAQLNDTISSRGATKFSLLAGSFNNLLGGNGTSFPVEKELDTLRVRFLFRNGSESPSQLTTYPLFGQTETSLSWTDVLLEMQRTTIETPGDWCNTCDSTSDMCAALRRSNYPDHPLYHDSSEGMSNAVAGAIESVVTLRVIGAVKALAAFLIMRRQWKRTAPAGIPLAVGIEIRRKGSERSLGSHFS
ncbi:histidine phosphatase superfamily [Aspergillus oleicola]